MLAAKLWGLLVTFTKLGLIGYGGGPAMIPLVESYVVDTYRWFSAEEFADAIALGFSLPGPVAPKLAAVTGYKVAGLSGAVTAVVAMHLPSLIAMIILFQLLHHYRGTSWADGMSKAVRPVVVILLSLLVLDMLPKAFTSITMAVIAVLALAAIRVFHVHPAVVVAVTLAYGAFFVR